MEKPSLLANLTKSFLSVGFLLGVAIPLSMVSCSEHYLRSAFHIIRIYRIYVNESSCMFLHWKVECSQCFDISGWWEPSQGDFSLGQVCHIPWIWGNRSATYQWVETSCLFLVCNCHPSIFMSSISFDMPWQTHLHMMFIDFMTLYHYSLSKNIRISGFPMSRLSDQRIHSSLTLPLQVQVPSRGCGSIRRKSAPQ